MKDKLKTLLSIVLISGLALFLLGFTFHRGGLTSRGLGRDCHGARVDTRVDEELAIEAEEEVIELEREYEQKLDDIAYDLERKRLDYQELYYSETADIEQLESLKDEIITLENMRRELRFEYRLELRELLSQEELESLSGRRDDMTRSRDDHHSEYSGGHHGGRRR